LELDDDAEFDSLGLDSLASMEAIYELEKEFGLSFSRDLFTKCPTVRAVNDFLVVHQRRAEFIDIPTPHPTQRSIVDSGIGGRQYLVSIQSCDHADDVPLLLVHDGSGLVNSYHRLPPLHRNVWAIHDPAVITGAKWDSLDEMATAYAEYVLEAIPGPLIVGGQSPVPFFLQSDMSSCNRVVLWWCRSI
jgi:acyl carrier protein